jgi:hypothetical protein
VFKHERGGKSEKQDMPEAEELSIKLLIRSRIETWLTVSTSNEM